MSKYVELNPVRAGLVRRAEKYPLVRRAEKYPWSSARAHATGSPDPLLSPNRPFPDTERVGDWREWLATDLDESEENLIRTNTYTGRPTGGVDFVERLEQFRKAGEKTESSME